jgi:hypothetical protein
MIQQRLGGVFVLSLLGSAAAIAVGSTPKPDFTGRSFPLGNLTSKTASNSKETFFRVTEGRLYDLEADSDKTHQGRFRFELGHGAGLRLFRSRYLDPTGTKVLAEERVRMKDGLLVDYSTYQSQGDIRGKVTIDRSKKSISYALFRKGKLDKLNKTELTSEEALVPPPLIVYRVLKSWKEVSAGKTQRFLIPIPHEQGSFRFKLHKNRESKDEVELALRPRSFFLQMFVDPLRFAWSLKDNQLTWFLGRVLSRRPKPDGSGFESMDAKIVVDHFDAAALERSPVVSQR